MHVSRGTFPSDRRPFGLNHPVLRKADATRARGRCRSAGKVGEGRLPCLDDREMPGIAVPTASLALFAHMRFSCVWAIPVGGSRE